MKDNTLHSPFQIPSPLEEKSVPNYLIQKANENASKGKVERITDTITGETYDFESLDRLTRSVASALYKRGFRNGDVVIYMTYDIVKLQIFQIGVWRANGIPRASYPEDDEDTIILRVEESRCGWIYCEPEAAEMCLSIASKIYWSVEVIVTGYTDGCTSIYELMEDDGSEMPESVRSGEDPALILNTSGTTGRSKGAVISHEAILWDIVLFKFHPFSYENTNLLVSKGTHISGTLLPLLGIVEGYHFLVMHTLKIENMFEAIHKYKPSHTFAFPSFLVALINHPSASDYDFSSLVVASSGGAPVTSAIEKIVHQLPNMQCVYNTYGLTEVAPVISTICSDATEQQQSKIADVPENSAGKLFCGVSAQFRDIETGEVLGPMQTGELCIKCPHLFTEYLDNPKATEDAFVDGFFKTGDVGYYDESEFIFLIDRAKEIFKYFGNHVSPTEIENVINDHPAVGEVCVIGVPDPEGGGFVPRAFCVILQDYECTPEDIKDYTNKKLPDYKKLRGGVYFVQELPKGKTGKVTRQLVEQLEID